MNEAWRKQSAITQYKLFPRKLQRQIFPAKPQNIPINRIFHCIRTISLWSLLCFLSSWPCRNNLLCIQRLNVSTDSNKGRNVFMMQVDLSERWMRDGDREHDLNHCPWGNLIQMQIHTIEFHQVKSRLAHVLWPQNNKMSIWEVCLLYSIQIQIHSGHLSVLLLSPLVFCSTSNSVQDIYIHYIRIN